MILLRRQNHENSERYASAVLICWLVYLKESQEEFAAVKSIHIQVTDRRRRGVIVARATVSAIVNGSFLVRVQSTASRCDTHTKADRLITDQACHYSRLAMGGSNQGTEVGCP